MDDKKRVDLDRVEQARQAFMRGECSSETYWAIRVEEYSKLKS